MSTGRGCLIEPEQIVGRGALCSLRINEHYVSAQHAALRWTGHGWQLRDLGSRNGTWLDGDRLAVGAQYALKKQSVIAFGRLEQKWQLVDDSAPPVMVVPLDGGAPLIVEADLLALPSSEDPHATLYKTSEGEWILEKNNDLAVPIAHLQIFEVLNRSWRFSCTEGSSSTSLVDLTVGPEIQEVRLAFGVSRDEEHVQLSATCRAVHHDLGARAHNYLLLTLARRRCADAREGFEPASCGWIYQEDLERDLAIATPQQVNIDVFRIRKQFAALGIVDAANIVQRRPRTRQLRIGTEHLTISGL